jgi:SAM-dependent methyltransferase
MNIWGFYVGNRSQNTILMYLTILLTIILVFLVHKHNVKNKNNIRMEGFAQSERFIVRHNLEIYDSFTAQIYDKIYQPNSTNQYIFDMVEKLTQSSKTKSVILDVGCGTGDLLGYIHQKGYINSFGVDQSPGMVEMALQKYPSIQLKEADLTQPMTYDKQTFTHIFLTGNTVYHFQDKMALLRNLYYWMIPNGYLILHVVDRERFDPIPPSGKPVLVDSVQSLVEERVTDTIIDFIDFQYKSSYDFTQAKTKNEVLFQETFTDANSHHVRMNEMTLYMEPMDEIIYMAQSVGFLVHGRIDLKETIGDPYQYVFVLERSST